MTDHHNPTTAALQLETPAALHRFTRAISSNLADATTIHFYEHRNTAHSVHGAPQVRLCATLSRADLRAPVELPAAANAAPIDTLVLDARDACALAAAALFTAGRKVVVWTVAADGRVSARMDGTPGCPGSLTPWLGDRPDDGVVLAVRPSTRNGVRTLGLAVWDPAASTLRAADLLDDDALAGLETVFVATNARELIVPDDVPDFDRAKLDELAERSSMAVTVRKRRAFDHADVSDIVHRLAGARHVEDAILDGKVAAGALAALIQYCELARDPNLEGKIRLSELAVAGAMKLDGSVMRALNILPFPGDGGKKASLYGLLNQGKSAMGSRLLRRWLSQPLQSIEAINERLDVVDAFISAPEPRRAIRDDHIAKLPDVNLLCRRFTKDGGAKAGLVDVVRLYQCSIRLPFLCDELCSEGNEGILAKRYAKPLRKLAGELRDYEALVEKTVDLEQIEMGEFVVNPSVDPELAELRGKKDDIVAEINLERENTARRIRGLKSMDNLKLEVKENAGYMFRLTRKEEKLIREDRSLIVAETRKDGVRFQSKNLRRLSQAYMGLADEYHQKEGEMRAKTLEVAGTFVEVFVDVSVLIAEMDVLCAFAVVAEESRSSCVRPKIMHAGTGVLLREARHPIVEENHNDGTEFISNTIDLRRKADTDSDDNATEEGDGGAVVLVTGPNMGGKSTYIRTAGVLTLMAHVGAFVPASEALVPLTDRIFARVGAGDNQHRALSTFMSEMVETAVILRNATWKSLVIIDELGRGTGTTDGFGIAHAIGKHIASALRCSCLFATHFYELTALADEVDNVRNAHVSAVTDAGGNGLTFLYEVQDGACDKSFGVHVAEMASFPPSVVEVAKRKAEELEGCVAAAKRIRTADVSEAERTAGRELMKEFTEKVGALPRSNKTEVKESVLKAKEMRTELLRKNNAYVAALALSG